MSSARDVSSLGGDWAVIQTYFGGNGGLDRALEHAGANAEYLRQARDRGELRGSLYRSTVFRGSPTVILTGLGKLGDFSGVRWTRAVEAGARTGLAAGFRNLAVVVSDHVDGSLGVRAAVEAAVRATYGPGDLKTSDREETPLEELLVITEGVVEDSALERARIIAESVNVARDLLNQPPSDLNPVEYAQRIEAIGQEAGFQVEVLDEGRIRELGMGAILGVAAGSAQPPRVLVLSYGDPNAEVKFGFVGKGLTYDSGGLSLKTHEGLEWMKGDMGGSAAVVGALRALSLLRPPGIFVRGIIGAVENMPGPAAMKPGDVLRTMNGKTIEVLNTDAEGRLVLSDILEYAVRLGSTHIVDLATLTGAAEVALGKEAAALVGRPQNWIDRVKGAADEALERVWQLPLFPEYRRQINSEVADMKNTGGRPGGALTAAALLAEFVDDVPWAHLDIAGTAWVERPGGYSATGGTGFGVATLVHLALSTSEA